MDWKELRNAAGPEAKETYATPLDKLPGKKSLDKFRGCLIGGAAGDALGYAVEFLSEHYIAVKYGAQGITEYLLHDGKAWVSDDTQMTMFTANGLLRGTAKGAKGGYPGYIAGAYRDWYKTQLESFAHCNRKFTSSWLLNVPEMFAARAPGNTCMSAIDAGCSGSMEHPANNSKGCGGVMRVAPIGLYFGESTMPPLAVDLLGAEAAALTHGHEMGYIPAAMLVHMVRLLSHQNGCSVKDAALDGMTAMEMLFPEAKSLPAFLALMEKAIDLAESTTPDLDGIHQLGEGWVGDEALAIAVFCAVRYAHDFDRALIAAVNHRGDSDSTGAIAGNILGASLGLSQIPQKYLTNLELLDVLTELADDLYDGPSRQEAWERKYITVNYPGSGAL